MVFSYPTNRQPGTLIIGVETASRQPIKIEAADEYKVNLSKDYRPGTFYADRKGIVDGYREFEIKMPKSPESLLISAYNVNNGNFMGNQDNTFRIRTIREQPLKTRAVWLSPEDISFIKFAQRFAQSASTLSAGDKIPDIYYSDDKKFAIAYYKGKIYDHNLKTYVDTPARIGHTSGIIDASKHFFSRYSVPMIMIILLHEYCHKYKNPKNGFKIQYETGADIAALNMYLSLGYSEIEAQQAFLYVFDGANTPENHKRYKILNDFIDKFNSGKLEEYYSTEKQIGTRKKAA